MARENQDARQGERQSGDLYATRPTVGLLVEQPVLVVGTNDAPDDHGDCAQGPRESGCPSTFKQKKQSPQEPVLCSLDEWHRYSLSNLAGIVDAEPLVGQVSAAFHHELRTEQAPESPTSDERGHHGVSESGERTPGPPVSLQQNGQGQR